MVLFFEKNLMDNTITIEINWRPVLTGELLLLGLLGRILYTYPGKEDPAWLQSLVDEDIFIDAPIGIDQPEGQKGLELLQRWTDACSQGDFTAEFEAMKLDYTHLFACAGEILAPPWGSVFFTKERLVLQEQTLDVRKFYRRFGLLPKDLFREPDDHIGLELFFVAHLAGLALQALEEVNHEQFNELMHAKHEFLADHLLKWGPIFCDQVDRYAKTDFYRGVALLLKGALIEMSAIYEIELVEPVAG